MQVIRTKVSGTVKFVAKILEGMVSLCIFGVMKDWYHLIDSLDVLCSCVTCEFIASASYMACIYMYVSLACLYMVFIYSYISHKCLYVVHVLHPFSMPQSYVRDTSICNMVCCCNNDPTSAPIGDANVARLPWGL